MMNFQIASLYFQLIIFLIHLNVLSPIEIQFRKDCPIIGILAPPSDFPDTYPPDDFSYIATSYVKFIESSGAQVIPIPYDLPADQMKFLFQRINGLVFPGGDAPIWDSEGKNLSKFAIAGEFLIKLAMEANSKGDFFPLFAFCMGNQLLLTIVANHEHILQELNSMNHRSKVRFTSHDSRMFRNIDESLQNYSENSEILYFNHRYGITPDNFLANPALNETFFITTTANTENGTTFVASLEGIKYPFYGLQFHPEKNPFEWRKYINATHTPQAVKISQEIGNFFINEARKNLHSFESQEKADRYTIYNYNSVKVNDSFMECYFFPKS